MTATPLTDSATELEQNAAQLDEAMAQLAALEPNARRVIQDALDALNRLHKDGLTTVVRRLREDDRGRELLYELVDDPGVRMLLAMHGIIRPDPSTLARQALDQVRPGLQSHGGDVEFSHLSDGVAYVRLQGACNGCSMAAVTMRSSVEEALKAAVPGLTGVEVLPNDPSPTLIPLDQLTVRRRDDETDQLLATGWCDVLAADTITAGQVHPVTVRPRDGDPVEAIVVSAAGRLSAYVNVCAHQGRRLDDALVDATEGTITCAGHGLCFDTNDGECLTLPGARLVALPVRTVDGRVWVRAQAE